VKTSTQLYKAFPIKDFGLVGWAEVQAAYEPFEYIFGFELLESIMARGGFELREWQALRSGNEARIKEAFNWYSKTLLGARTEKRQPKGRKMSEGNAVKVVENIPSATEDLNLKIVEKIEKFGAGTWELLHKESSKSDGWAETTKAMEIPGKGVVIKVTCSCRNDSGVTVLTNATTFVPDVSIIRSTDDAGVVIGRNLSPTKVTARDFAKISAAVDPDAPARGKRKGKKARKNKSTKAATKKIAKAAKAGPKKKKAKGRGRPKGSKNKPK
jgi:hypothetical protein